MRVLLILGGVVAYLGWIYFHPFKPCPRCKGKGTNLLSTKRRAGQCPRCHGTRSVQAIGSKTLHRAVRSVVRYRNDKEK